MCYVSMPLARDNTGEDEKTVIPSEWAKFLSLIWDKNLM